MYPLFDWDLAPAQKLKAPALFLIQNKTKQPSIRRAKCLKCEGRNMKAGDMKY